MTNVSFASGLFRPIYVITSSSVFHLSSLASERFGQSTQFRAPVVESAGTGRAYSVFCSNNSRPLYDVIIAPRIMRDSERSRCEENGIVNLGEVVLGRDVIVIVNSINDTSFFLSGNDLFKAIGARSYKDGTVVDNFYNNWSQISPDFPDRKILIYGPSEGNATRTALMDFLIMPHCEGRSEFRNTFDKDLLTDVCNELRKDGRFIEYDDNVNVALRKIEDDRKTLAIVSYNAYLRNKSKLRISSLDGVLPNKENVLSGRYPLSREVVLYYKKDHVDDVPGLKDFVADIQSPNAVGPNGYMTFHGLFKG